MKCGMCMLHWVVVKILHKKSRNLARVNELDIYLMWLILTQKEVSWVKLIMDPIYTTDLIQSVNGFMHCLFSTLWICIMFVRLMKICLKCWKCLTPLQLSLWSNTRIKMVVTTWTHIEKYIMISLLQIRMLLMDMFHEGFMLQQVHLLLL